MQKLLQRSQRAKRMAARHLEKKKLQQEGAADYKKRYDLRFSARQMTELYKDARKNRQVDWDTGVLAPRRDVGDKAETYGTMDVFTWASRPVPSGERLSWWHISDGDRVVVMRGRDRGKIGTVNAVEKDSNVVRVKGVYQVDVVSPDWLAMEDSSDTNKMQTVEKSIPVQDVKLVYPLPDPKTGTPRDTIIDRLQCINRLWDKNKREWTDGDRVIPGTNTIIPWPEKIEPEVEDNEADTTHDYVREESFVPYLLEAPMPLTVIDELRNKYSKFRTRHDWEYIDKRQKEEERTERRKGLIKTMQTPLQELAELRAQQKKATEKELTMEQLARIGEVIAQERRQVTTEIQQSQS